VWYQVKPRQTGEALQVFAVALVLGLFPGVPGQAAEEPGKLTSEWAFTIRDSTDSSPAIGPDGTIYFGTFGGKLWALNSNGSPQWSFSAGREIKSSPALAPDGSIYFGCRDRRLYALGPDGKKKWDFRTGAWVDSSAAVASDGTIYFGSWDKSFYALGPDGVKKWQFQTGGEVVSSAAIDAAGRVCFGSHDRKLYVLNPDGTKGWEYITGGPILSSPAIDKDGTVYFTSVDGFFYALSSEGDLKWRLKTGGISESSPVIGQDGTLYVGVNKKLWAMNSEGKKMWDTKWENPYEDLIEASPLVLADGSVCYVGRSGQLFNVFSGDPPANWIHYLYGHGASSPAVGLNGTIYIKGTWTNFYALRTSVSLAQSPWPKFRGNAQNSGRLAPLKVQN
jgi:outer membrane protein assembly factor BamB